MGAVPFHPSADAWTGAAFLPRDDRAAQCRRAARYMQGHPGCTLRELGEGADLGSPSKVVSEMGRAFGYQVRRQRVRVPCRDNAHSRSVTRYWLEAWPALSQIELFPEA
jgi:hypothetical protein